MFDVAKLDKIITQVETDANLNKETKTQICRDFSRKLQDAIQMTIMHSSDLKACNILLNRIASINRHNKTETSKSNEAHYDHP